LNDIAISAKEDSSSFSVHIQHGGQNDKPNQAGNRATILRKRSQRPLNPKFANIIFENGVLQLRIDIISDSIWAKSTSVESKW